jgi:hypothetical protein
LGRSDEPGYDQTIALKTMRQHQQQFTKICLSFDSDMPQMKLTATAVEKRNPPDKHLR